MKTNDQPEVKELRAARHQANTISNRLRASLVRYAVQCRAHGTSVSEVAALGVSTQTIHKWHRKRLDAPCVQLEQQFTQSNDHGSGSHQRSTR